MKILITGGCGFVGTNIALYLNKKGHKIFSLDNLSRKGSKYNHILLRNKKIKNYTFNIADSSKILKLQKFDLIIDCCAEPSVEKSKKNINKVIDTNLTGTINILNKIKKDKSKIIFLSSSRVYPIHESNKIFKQKIFNKEINVKKTFDEKTSTQGVKTLYGVTKLASEMFVEEYSYAFGIKYIINRCGVISGPLQFGKQDQGFISLWIWRHIIKKKLSYIGYGGFGYQGRDVLHIYDLCELINLQVKNINKINNCIFTVGGSKKNFISLKNLTSICQKITNNKIKIGKKPQTSIYDIPYFVTNNFRVSKSYNWRPKKNIPDIIKDTHSWLTQNKLTLKKYF